MFNKIILKNFKSNLHNYILFFISNIVAVAEMIAFWGMNDIVTKAITDKVTAAALKMDFKIAAGLITVITVLLMVFSMKHYIQLRMKDYSTFVILGMRKRTSYLMMLTEYVAGCVFSLILGILLGIGLLYGIQYWIRGVYPEFIKITAFDWKILRNACGLSIGIMALVFVALITWMDGKDMSAFMSSAEQNEKRPVSGRWLLLVVVGVVLLVIGEDMYQGSDSMYLTSHAVFPAGMVLIVVFGLAWVLERLRKRKKFYLRHIFQLNQLYSKFQNNLMILILLLVIHFFALTYLTVEISSLLPLDRYRENYPYDSVWIAREEDREYAKELAEKYDGTVIEFPMLRVTTAYTAQQIGVSASTYQKLTGKDCDLEGREIWFGMEDAEFQKEKDITNWDSHDLYEDVFVGNYDPEFNMVMLKNTEEGKPYHYELTKAFTQSLIGQYSLDQYHENMVIFSDEFFEERWQEVRRDKTEASELYLFTFPARERADAYTELTAYNDANGIKNKNEVMMENSLYNTDEFLKGQRMRAVFSLSSKLFLMATLLLSGFFVVALKNLSEMASFKRRYEFLNYMGMKEKEQRKNIRFETKILTMISAGAAFVMGVLYVCSYLYQQNTGGGNGVETEFWKYWAAIMTAYLVVVYLIQQLFGWYVIRRLKRERRKQG